MLADHAEPIAEGAVHLLTAGGELRGVVSIAGDGGLFLEPIAVQPDFQGRGMGRRLMAFVEEETGRRVEAGYRRVYFRKLLA